MPDQLVDNPQPLPREADPDVEANAAGGAAPIQQVSINRSTVAELERRRMLHLQTAAVAILAGAAVLSLIYVAKLLLVVILISILLAFVLAPIADLLVRFQVPRAFGAFIAVMLLVLGLAAATYVSYSRALEFMQELPHYKAHIQALGKKVREQAEQIEKTTETMLPSPEGKRAIAVTQTSSWTDLVSRNANSVSEVVLALTFIPFLVFFMLSWQDHVRSATVMLFSMENRNSAYVMLGLIARMIRSFIVGNFIIGVFVSACSIALFGLIGLPYFYFLGVISGFLSLIPYLGVLLALIPPLVADLGHLTTGVALLVIAIVVGLHLGAMNVLYPKILGRRLQLNPLAVTIALLFWGWLWGAMGLVLAVPITGAAKIICDHIEPLRPYGVWLGE
ncbi:MAG TPA: AI-2E family transporter [Terriglobales bacterium]|nr:AI-2E family transporter [Terriglobales bacterium]